jgi:hypothetical protein
MRLPKPAPDTALEALFPEHPWRQPVRARFAIHHRGEAVVVKFIVCRFCLYRQGLVQAYLRNELQTFAMLEQAEAHIEQAHPVNSH